MGRLQKKKTENQKLKQKDKQKLKSELDSDVNGTSGKQDALSNGKVKRFSDQKKNIALKKIKTDQEPGLYVKISNFLREVKAELKKVVWPARNQTAASTVVVIVLVIIVSSFLGLFDFGLKGLIQMVLH